LYDLAGLVKGFVSREPNFRCYLSGNGRPGSSNSEKSLHDLLDGAMMRTRRSGTGREQVTITMRARKSVMGLAAGTLIMAAGVSMPKTVGAATTFEAVAAADGIRVGMRVPNAPVTDTPVDSGGPTAQAVLNSSGVSRAFASHPYPGEAVVTGPGTVAGFTGGQVSPPAYPFAVASDYPTVAEQSNESGPYILKVSSGERRSESEARVGAAPGPLVSSQAVVELDAAGGATGAAVSDVSSLAVGDVRLGRVLSTARVTRGADGDLTRSSDLQVTGFTVAGTAVALGPAGLTLAGSAVPLPPADPVRQTLAGAGITVTYLAAQPQPNGVVAPGLAISAPVQLAGGNTATVTYTLGQTSASIAGVPVPGGDIVNVAIPDDFATPAGSGSASASPQASNPLDSAAAVGLPSVTGVASTPLGASAGGAADGFASSPDAAASVAAPDLAAASGPSSGTAIGAEPVLQTRGFDSAGIFLVLAGACLVAFCLVSLFSALGVRSR
jgi:hypothetical protein